MVTVTERLIPILERPIGDADRKRAALLLLDWTGCAIAGRKQPAGEKAFAALDGDNFTKDPYGSNSANPMMEALKLGFLGNVLEMDDVDRQAILHAAPTIMPAAIAMAEYVRAEPDDFLDAMVLGYETTIRIGRAVGAGHYAFWHNTATCGPFGAAVAACHLLDGSDPVSALGLAGTQAAGLWQTRHEPDSMAKQIHAGHAAHAGVLAALLSTQGFQGPRSILDGEQGFFAAMCPGANPGDILKNPDADWLIHETSLKPYPACRHAHPTIDAALGLRDKINPANMGTVRIETYGDALKFCDNPDPGSTIEAKFSLQHSAAIALLRGVPRLDDFEHASIHDPDVMSLRGKIIVEATDGFNADYPAHFGASIDVDGHSFTARDAYGDPEKPMTEDAVIEKAVMLMMHGGLSGKKARRICARALDLAQGGSIKKYTKLI